MELETLISPVFLPPCAQETKHSVSNWQNPTSRTFKEGCSPPKEQSPTSKDSFRLMITWSIRGLSGSWESHNSSSRTRLALSSFKRLWRWLTLSPTMCMSTRLLPTRACLMDGSTRYLRKREQSLTRAVFSIWRHLLSSVFLMMMSWDTLSIAPLQQLKTSDMSTGSTGMFVM